MKKKKIYLILLAISLWSPACKKNWLDAKPNNTLIVPSTIQDYQSLMDNSAKANASLPGLGEMAADNFYLTYSSWQALQVSERNNYIWAKDIFAGGASNDWTSAYTRILNDNVALEGINTIVPVAGTAAAWNNVKGSALFYRALDFYGLAQEFSSPYAPTTAQTDLGIPLRLASDVNQPSVRATVAMTYSQILGDLVTAKGLLPLSPLYKTRPSKPAAYGLLARTCLAMENYPQAKLYADSCLQLYAGLLDYNTLSVSSSRPFARFNAEVIYHAALVQYTSANNGIVDPALFSSYQATDLRKKLFFTAAGLFKGQYTAAAAPFGGLATDEIYLIRAEAQARAGNTAAALSDLNTLLVKRFATGTFIPVTAASADEALARVLAERQKELVFRNLRWADLRRLNKDPRFAKTLEKTLNGTVYTLPSNDLRYVFPIPDNEVKLSGYPQNPR